MSIADLVTAARPADPAAPGSGRWKRRCTASKIAPILGVSPWQSRYEVWHNLAGHPMPSETTYPMLRGIHLEQGVIDLWHALNPDWEVEETADWQSIEREWLFARPDGLLLDPTGRPWALEVKTTTTWEGWGPDGSTVIPVQYDCQTICQKAVLGLPVLLVALGPGFEMRVYERDPDPWVIDGTMEEVAAFLDTLPGGPAEQEPEPWLADEPTVKRVTPIYRGWRRTLDDDDPDALALADARLALDEAESRYQAARMVSLLRMQQAETIRWRGRTLMSRKSDGSLYVAPADTLREVIQ